MHMNLLAILDGTKSLENLTDPYFGYKFDFYDESSKRLCNLFRVRIYGNRKLEFWCGLARVRDIDYIDVKNVSAVLTPDGEWHDDMNLESFDDLEDQYLSLYPNCIAVAVDYHV